jgi:hypothetical protein
MVRASLLAIFLILSIGFARADSDTLLPITFNSLQGDLKKALTKNAIREPLSAFSCLEGSAEKRKVCTYKLGDYMQIMAETEKGGKDIVGLTMICATNVQSDSLKCLLAYAAAMSMAAPELKADDRGKIMNVLIEGLSVGTLVSIRTEERKFILQKSIGLWFHINAADVDE